MSKKKFDVNTELAKHEEAAAKRLVDLMASNDSRVALKAVETILSRINGRPYTQSVPADKIDNSAALQAILEGAQIINNNNRKPTK